MARFCASAGKSHWAVLHHLMEYLEAHQSFKLTYRKRSALSNGLTGFADSDWVMNASSRSTAGNLFLYNRSPISWRSKLQKTIALSTAEYYSASTAAVEVIYLRSHLRNMGFAPESWTFVYEDNNACIERSNNIIRGRERAKHIDISKLMKPSRMDICVWFESAPPSKLQTSSPRDFTPSPGLLASSLFLA